VLGLFRRRLADEKGSDIVEYAVSVALIVLMVVGTLRVMGGNISTVFSAVAASLESQKAD
jgi:Flp pilus assembly pilin Flp